MEYRRRNHQSLALAEVSAQVLLVLAHAAERPAEELVVVVPLEQALVEEHYPNYQRTVAQLVEVLALAVVLDHNRHFAAG